MSFVNRKDELKQFKEWFETESSQLIVLYGRRRIGKTRLLTEFSMGKKTVFFSSPRTSGKEALELFSEQIADAFPGKGLEYVQFSSFRKAFEFLFAESINNPLILILDEFPYLLEAEPGIDVHLQHLWDHRLDKSKINIFLCGSTLSIMQKKILGKNAPLYGRRTGSINLTPFNLFDSRLFMPDDDIETAVHYYAVYGGIPFYLEQIRSDVSLSGNIISHFLHSNGFLYNEPYFLVQEELRDPKLYFAIMHAVASGNTRPAKIASHVGIDANKIGKYLSTLLQLKLIAREMPITVKPSSRSTKGYYKIADPFLRFWFRYIYPNSSAIELGNGELVWNDIIKPNLSTFVGPIWEDVCRQYLIKYGGSNFEFTSPIMKIGRYWQNDFEIDIVAENSYSKEVLFCECKWSKKPDPKRLLDKLKIQTGLIPEYQGFKKYYGIFSRGEKTATYPHTSIKQFSDNL